jgi:hypothetical protein
VVGDVCVNVVFPIIFVAVSSCLNWIRGYVVTRVG